MTPVLIIHYNTPTLTSALIRSVIRTTPGAAVTVFDNSDCRPLHPEDRSKVRYIDNTQAKVINFRSWLGCFPGKHPSTNNDYGSAKHTYTIQRCFDILPDGFILLDSDTLVKQDLTPLVNSDSVFTGDIHTSEEHHINIPRVLPYVCHINVPLCRRQGVNYYNPLYTWKLTSRKPNRFYDTGAWFLRSAVQKGAFFRTIRHEQYVEHLGAASWSSSGGFKDRERCFLEENERLWKSTPDS